MRLLSELEQSRRWKAVTINDGRQILLLNYPAVEETCDQDEVNRNLLCLDEENRVVWQVKPPLPNCSTGDPFVHVENENGVLKATRFSGDLCEIDVKNGLAKIVGWTK